MSNFNDIFQSQNYENSSLCFSKDYFYAPNFDCDSFLTRYKREYGLERLNNDLAIYLKVLKSSMSELINKEYADFVNLSINLVGLDKAINDLKKPLIAIKNDVESIQVIIDKESSQLLSKINEKLSIEKRRIVIKLLMNWQRSLKVTNEMITNDLNTQKLTGDYIERIAFEFRQLKHSLTFCQKEITQNNDINKLSLVLEKTLQDLFIKSFNSNDTDQLRHVLKSYILLSKQQLVERLYQETFVKPYMSQYINENYLDSNDMKLDGVFNKILLFIDDHSQFLCLTSEIECSGLNSSDPTSEFNFLLNSIWSHVVESIDLNLNQIFSPVDPISFHKTYLKTIKFLQDFEVKCFNQLNFPSQRLRSSKSYKYFLKKWPVNIYFQIRFQEIAFKFEQNLLLNQSPETTSENDYFYLKVTNCLYESLNYCWSGNCFLNCLTSSFWKLNLQLLSRYENYYRLAVIEQQNASVTATSETVNSEHQQQQVPVMNDASDLKLLVYLIADIKKLCDRLPNFFDGNVAPLMRASGVKEIGFVKESMSISICKFQELIILINDRIVGIVVQQASVYLKNANEMPRLYRRTNRELSKTASDYIKSTIQYIVSFNSEWNLVLDSTSLNSILKKIIDQLGQKYFSISNDLLSSVKKMEDSLKRLKRVRGDAKTDSNKIESNSNATATVIMSDDDKIRLQLYTDVVEFGSSLMEKFSYQGEDNYNSLFKLVDSVKRQIDA